MESIYNDGTCRHRDFCVCFSTIRKTVWLPENASIANIINGTFVNIEDVKISGTASKISFEEFRNKFSDAKITVYTQNKFGVASLVYYITKQKDEVYYSYIKLDSLFGSYNFSYKKNLYAQFKRTLGTTIFIVIFWLLISYLVACKKSGKK